MNVGGALYGVFDVEPFCEQIQAKTVPEDVFILEGEKVGKQYIVHDSLLLDNYSYDRRLESCRNITSALGIPLI